MNLESKNPRLPTLPTVLHAKRSKGSDRKPPENRRWISRFKTENHGRQLLFESPDTRTGAEAPVLTHQQKPPINSCVRDENANR